MESKLIHIAPFDIGCSFFDYEYTKRQNRQEFIKCLSEKCLEKGMSIDNSSNDRYMYYVKLNEKTSCYLLECGVGVFTFENLDISDMTHFSEVFDNNFVCDLYYLKKIEQKKILHQREEFVKVNEFMEIVWSSVYKMIRPFSASKNYKYNGLSYVMSVYHIIDGSQNLEQEYNRDIDLLMNPDILSKIEKEEQWGSIKEKIRKHKTKGYNRQVINDVSVVASSWSAVAVIEEKETEVISKIIEYEVNLQASWFLFDCLIDNIKHSKMSNLDLQKEKSLVTNASLEISNILSANMSTNEKNVMESIYATSGINTLKEKLFLLLENRIAIEEAKISEKQGIYGVITEILLVIFTLVSIYEPVKNLISGTIGTADLVIGGIMLVVLIICSILIIGKGK
ncbi:hypothetical protein [Anaerotignum sp.]|uniref:hypothetical protein n=1 Tax=Anaerotignum sp. TaxID=2039241 RepID=UPI0033321639